MRELEVTVQNGIRLFTSDEAFMSGDWVGNSFIIFAFHTKRNELMYFNRAYPELRKRYRDMLTTEMVPGVQQEDPTYKKCCQARRNGQ